MRDGGPGEGKLLFQVFLLPPRLSHKGISHEQTNPWRRLFPAFDWAISPTHPEREERLLYTQDQLREEGLFDLPGITEYKPGVATYEDIERVHFCLPDVGRVCSCIAPRLGGRRHPAGELVLPGNASGPSPWCGLRDITPCASPTATAASAT